MKCGLRPGEIQKLRWEDVDVNALTLNVFDTKKHKRFPIPMDLTTADYLRELRGERGEGWVIDRNPKSCGWRHLKTCLSLENLEHILKKWARLAGCESWQKMRVYDLRHFFAASWAYPSDGKRPGNLHALSRILRHTSLLNTQIYLGRLVFYEDIQAEYNRLQTQPFLEGSPFNVPPVGNAFFDAYCRLCGQRATCKFVDQAMMSPWASGCKYFQKVLEKECGKS
jgi:integrase